MTKIVGVSPKELAFLTKIVGPNSPLKGRGNYENKPREDGQWTISWRKYKKTT
jgi:hypothetical protein